MNPTPYPGGDTVFRGPAGTDLFAYQESHPARVDAGTAVLWEPLWQLRTELRLVERALLACPPLRRIHFVHHGGVSFVCTQRTYSRLQHTLGVFSLIAHFCPEDEALRAAALLHDTGHAPFSHTLEGLGGIDHHHRTQEIILSTPIADLLVQHGLDPQAVLACIGDGTPNLLWNGDDVVHADHLDSWVRSAHAAGALPRPAPGILARLHLRGPYLETDLETAELLAHLIVAEAHYHMSSANLGPSVILRHLVWQLLERGALEANALSTATESVVECALLTNPITAAEARRLWYRPEQIVVRQLGGETAPAYAHTISIDHLYLAMPLVDGQVVTRLSPRAQALLDKGKGLLGTYAVYWATPTEEE